MKDLLKEETVGGAQAILVGLITRGRDETECEVSMDELERLLDTAGGMFEVHTHHKRIVVKTHH